MSSKTYDRVSRKLFEFQRFAVGLGTLSTCKRAGVGCIIFPHNFSQVLGIGYNGPAAGESNDACSNVPGLCGCVHAEANAVTKMREWNGSCVLLCTTAPCLGCASLILNKGNIDLVLWMDAYRETKGLDLLDRHITTLHIEDGNDLIGKWFEDRRVVERVARLAKRG